MPKKIRSHLTAKTVIVTFPDSTEKALILDLEIDCLGCGTHTLRLVGHHLRAIRNVLMEIIDQHPDLVGDEAGLEVVKRITFSGSPSPEPERN